MVKDQGVWEMGVTAPEQGHRQASGHVGQQPGTPGWEVGGLGISKERWRLGIEGRTLWPQTALNSSSSHLGKMLVKESDPGNVAWSMELKAASGVQGTVRSQDFWGSAKR